MNLRMRFHSWRRLIGLGRVSIPPQEKNPLNRWLVRGYRPFLDRVLGRPVVTIVVGIVLHALTAFPIMRLGGEFLPPLDQGGLLR
jgi:Cu(I)/Ag(I) efflux system membrane protein CusA/SilA